MADTGLSGQAGAAATGRRPRPTRMQEAAPPGGFFYVQWLIAEFVRNLDLAQDRSCGLILKSHASERILEPWIRGVPVLDSMVAVFAGNTQGELQ